MKLVNFSVTNFRSITKAYKVDISQTTVILGKNNEGKSNLLKALSVSMNAIIMHSNRRPLGSYRYVSNGLDSEWRYRERQVFSWERDCPVNLQENDSEQSIFKLEFELDDSEIDEFVKEIKSNLDGKLPIEIRIGNDDKPHIKVSKRGRGSKVLNAKSEQITAFIAQRIRFNYIPAIRTDKQALSVIEALLSQELSALEDQKEYKDALKAITSLQKPILEKLAAKIKTPLNEFLPNIKKVKINVRPEGRRLSLRRDFEVIIDDGTPTSIEFKGDGVKSLAALGLLKNYSLKRGASIIAIEEPESHLHSGAIHQLNEIITALADENQIVITTHNPLFVNRSKLESNIIVESGEASKATSIAQIRDVLGVKASDNLTNARYTLVVEGRDDKISLEALLPTLSNKIAKAFQDRLLIIDSVGGAGNLSYKLSMLRSALCTYHVLLDRDSAGIKAYNDALSSNFLTVKNATFVICDGMEESEFEDCINKDVYAQRMLEEFSVDISKAGFRGNKKWSSRMKAGFLNQGKNWDNNLKHQAKKLVADCIKARPAEALNSNKRNSIDALVSALESMIAP